MKQSRAASSLQRPFHEAVGEPSEAVVVEAYNNSGAESQVFLQSRGSRGKSKFRKIHSPWL